jgi:hypothetical protein
MLTEKKEIDKIEIVKNIIQVRELITVLKEEQIIASSHNRYSVHKEDDVKNFDPKVQAIARAIWPDKFLTTDTISGSI